VAPRRVIVKLLYGVVVARPRRANINIVYTLKITNLYNINIHKYCERVIKILYIPITWYNYYILFRIIVHIVISTRAIRRRVYIIHDVPILYYIGDTLVILANVAFCSTFRTVIRVVLYVILHTLYAFSVSLCLYINTCVCI
jgi:hypothetical protein